MTSCFFKLSAEHHLESSRWGAGRFANASGAFAWLTSDLLVQFLDLRTQKGLNRSLPLLFPIRHHSPKHELPLFGTHLSKANPSSTNQPHTPHDAMTKKALNLPQKEQKSIEERMEEGKALRDKVPRIDQAHYKPSAKRADPVAILEAQGLTRLPELVPIRYARMLTSPFAFLRGGAAIMAADLAAQGKTTGIQVQACGDMHLANFGLFASAERNLVFGLRQQNLWVGGGRGNCARL